MKPKLQVGLAKDGLQSAFWLPLAISPRLVSLQADFPDKPFELSSIPWPSRRGQSLTEVRCWVDISDFRFTWKIVRFHWKVYRPWVRWICFRGVWRHPWGKWTLWRNSHSGCIWGLLTFGPSSQGTLLWCHFQHLSQCCAYSWDGPSRIYRPCFLCTHLYLSSCLTEPWFYERGRWSCQKRCEPELACIEWGSATWWGHLLAWSCPEGGP